MLRRISRASLLAYSHTSSPKGAPHCSSGLRTSLNFYCTKCAYIVCQLLGNDGPIPKLVSCHRAYSFYTHTKAGIQVRVRVLLGE